ncbi:MAG: hypothetical protein K6T34_07580 [Thermoflavifilum sp.]|nr:hypothetical protein [Thermoflavifilum sp.]
MAKCDRLLKPLRSLLIRVSGRSDIDHDGWRNHWQSSSTAALFKQMLSSYSTKVYVQLYTSSNVLAATAFLYGLADDELTTGEKNDHDPHYPVINAAKAIVLAM